MAGVEDAGSSVREVDGFSRPAKKPGHHSKAVGAIEGS